MVIWVAACWGLAGGISVEGLELYARIRRAPGWTWRKPIPQGLASYLISVVIRGGLSAVVVAAAADGRQVVSVFAAFGLGVAAPLVIEKLARTVPLTLPADPVDAAQTGGAEPMHILAEPDQGSDAS